MVFFKMTRSDIQWPRVFGVPISPSLIFWDTQNYKKYTLEKVTPGNAMSVNPTYCQNTCERGSLPMHHIHLPIPLIYEFFDWMLFDFPQTENLPDFMLDCLDMLPKLGGLLNDPSGVPITSPGGRLSKDPEGGHMGPWMDRTLGGLEEVPIQKGPCLERTLGGLEGGLDPGGGALGRCWNTWSPLIAIGGRRDAIETALGWW